MLQRVIKLFFGSAHDFTKCWHSRKIASNRKCVYKISYRTCVCLCVFVLLEKKREREKRKVSEKIKINRERQGQQEKETVRHRDYVRSSSEPETPGMPCRHANGVPTTRSSCPL